LLTQGGEVNLACCVLPDKKLYGNYLYLLSQKIDNLNTLHLQPAQTRKGKKKELPNSYNIKLLTYRHPIFKFLQKMRAWSRSK